MSTNNEQNGRQPPLPNRPPLPSDPRAGNVSDQQRPLCRKYVWGTCTKGVHCKFRHDLDVEEMKKILKFCHDFQNKQGCGRVDCTYLHASKEEETLFRSNNQIPRVLLERYAALAEASNSIQSFEGVPQMMMFVTAPPPPPPPPQPAPVFPPIQQPPPPPPPPTLPPSSNIQSAPVFTGPPPQGAPVVFPLNQPPLPLPPMFDASRPPPPITVQTKNGAVKKRLECEDPAAPPPPPPPTLPPSSNIQSAPVFTGPPPQGAPVVFPLNQPPLPLPPMFDASRPQPSIPVQTKNGAVKRRLECEAGPSKVRKPEGPIVAENPCENCVQRGLRIDVYKQEMEKIRCEQQYQNLVYKKKLKEYENGKEILRALVSSDLYRILDEYVEGGPPQVQDLILAQLNTNPIMSLIECIISSRNVVDSTLSPTLSRLDDTLSSFSSLSRITNPITNSSTDLLHTLIEVLRSNTERETRSEPEVRTSTPALTNSSINGFNRFPNGQLPEVSTPAASTSNSSRFTATPASTVPRTYPSGAGPSVTSAAGPPAAQPAPAYPPYHPSVPPPTNRPYYPQPYGGPGLPSSSSVGNSMSYSSHRVGAPPMGARPPASAMASPMPPHYNQYNMMGRYPHASQYYPPYQ